jgi:hypothetical protein
MIAQLYGPPAPLLTAKSWVPLREICLEVNSTTGGGQFSQEVHWDQAGRAKARITRAQKTKEAIAQEKIALLLSELIIAAPLRNGEFQARRSGF